MQEAPKIDSRSGEKFFHDLARDLKERLDIDADGGDPLAEALLRVFARYSELIIQRLNKVPDRNHAAFLDVLNVSRIPPVPAQVPLTFTPVKKLPRPIVVRAYTQVAAAPGEGESELTVFETMCDLSITNIKLKKVLALDPQADLYADKSSLALLGEGGPGEFAFHGKWPVPHEFYVGHGPIFGRAGITQLHLRFEIEGSDSSGSSQQAVEWWIPTPHGEVSLTPVRDTTSGMTQNGEVVFKDLSDWPTHEIFCRETHWLGCRSLDRLQTRRIADREIRPKLPLVRAMMISASWEVEETAVDNAFFNNLSLELSKDFFPFGERPRFGDVFYLSCDVFSKPQAKITLKIKLTNPASAGEEAPIPPVSKKGQPKIQWEHWDGRRWVKLECMDGTEALTEDGEVSLLAPSPLLHTAVNGLEGCWIRARLVSGSYGGEERFEFTDLDQGFRRIRSTLAPPSIQSITVTSSLTVGPEQPQLVVTNNNLVFEEIDGAAPSQPFRLASEPHRALYLGFEVPDDDQNALADSVIDLYFHMSGSEDRAFIREGMIQQLLRLTWQYWNGKDWTEASVKDGTESLTMSGMVNVCVDDDIAPWRESSFDPGLYWLKVLWTSGDFECPPKLCRVLLNTVPAAQTTTIENELLGSSNGQPNQTFCSARVPILHDLHLEVREPDMPPDDELARINKQAGEDTVTVIRDSQGKIQQIWTRWHEVDDFLSSNNRDRHFVVDRQNGEIRFGDSTRGIIPPAAANNIRLRRYQTGGGSFGNKPAGSIIQLRTSVLYVDSVVNIEPAFGGQDIEDWDSVRERGGRWLRHRGRAVTMEDYEDLTMLASPIVDKAKCYPNRDLAVDPAGRSIRPGVVSLIIVPRSVDQRPLPDLNLLRRVRNFMNVCRVPDTELVVLAPEYVRAIVEAVVVAAGSDTVATVVAHCEQELGQYLHPLTGGPDGRGWEFGERPHESDFYALLEAVHGVQYVRSLNLRMEEEHPGLLQSGFFLICAGEHRVRLGL